MKYLKSVEKKVLHFPKGDVTLIPVDGTDSDEEMYFDWWLEEMKKRKLVLGVYQALPIDILDQIPLHVERQLKTKKRWDTYDLLPAKQYRIDRVVHWSPRVYKMGLLKPYYASDSALQVYSEENPDAFHLVFLRLGIFIQAVKLRPSGKKKGTKNHLFRSTFTPLRFTRTDTGKQRRVIHYSPIITIDEYLKQWHL